LSSSDEWAFQQFAREIWTAAFPTINRPTGGQLIGLSTISRGTLFEDIWQKSREGRNSFERVFLGWAADPRRTPEWYEQTKSDLGDAVYAEYPASEEEAFKIPGGAFFSEVREYIHLRPPRPVPDYFKRYVSLDYGLDALAALWYYVDGAGRARIYRQLYKSDLIISEAAKAILRANGGDAICAYLAPPDLWNSRQETGRSAADIFADNGVPLTMTSNDRLTGWLAVKEWLKPLQERDEQSGGVKTTARLTIDEGAAPDLWRCLLNIQRDKRNYNDVADYPHELTHLPDSLRCFAAYWITPSKEPERPKARVWQLESDTYQTNGVMEW
jgi:hypothetical protein